ncbi:hypothetical protein [Streptomyces luteocolor]|uniref:hypothetical protein n=1 Tax=Streptomyces luteocolor TaxID=285500 RepID=UPI0008531E8D|nr:hypothetical protein [Streptomyces luteocolor]
MAGADDILNQIDHTLRDWTVGPDAMRSRPDEPTAPRLWIAPVGTGLDGDGWEEIGGVTSVDIDYQQEPVEHGYARDEAILVISVDARAFTAGMVAAVEGLTRLREALGELRHGEWIDTNGDPVQQPERPRPALPRRDGRPAWQSPYGPPQPRR